jgi:hypothetical protein
VYSSGLQAPPLTNKTYVQSLLLFLDCSEPFESRRGDERERRRKSVEGVTRNTTFIGVGVGSTGRYISCSESTQAVPARPSGMEAALFCD